MSKGNALAFIVLFGWPLFSIWLYRRKSLQLATLITIIGGFMTLAVKTSVDFPLIPPLGKNSVPILSAVLGCWMIKKQKIKYFDNKGLVKIFILFLFMGAFITTGLNSDRVIIGAKVLPGLTLHDAIASVINVFIQMSPFFIGKQFFRAYQNQLLMFRFIVAAGLIYSIPILYEIRMSPQLHSMFYGYFPHSFAQQARDGGFRSVVFMGHGLLVSFFVVCVLSAAAALEKLGEKVRHFSPKIVNYYFLIVLILCKSKAAILYGIFAFVMIRKMPYKMQFRAAAILALITLLYPSMSVMKIFPHQWVVQTATNYLGADRASSLKFRFDNEKILLEHARKRFLFGWGGWGRNRARNEETGADVSVTDGVWIIVLGVSGIVGFIAQFGLLAISIFKAKTAAKLIKDKQQQTLLAAHALLIGIVMVDQIPNASLAPWLWLITGALLGRAEAIISESKKMNSKRNSLKLTLISDNLSRTH